MKVHPQVLLVLAVATATSAWTTVPALSRPTCRSIPRFFLSDDNNNEINAAELTFESEEQKKQVVGNLVADDEWEGLTLELTDLVRKSCT